MSKEILSIDQRLQVARMATDLVSAHMSNRNSAINHFTSQKPQPYTHHDLLLFVYDVIVKKVTDESGND